MVLRSDQDFRNEQMFQDVARERDRRSREDTKRIYDYHRKNGSNTTGGAVTSMADHEADVWKHPLVPPVFGFSSAAISAIVAAFWFHQTPVPALIVGALAGYWIPELAFRLLYAAAVVAQAIFKLAIGLVKLSVVLFLIGLALYLIDGVVN